MSELPDRIRSHRRRPTELRRTRNGAVLVGVCAAVARYYHLDPGLVRTLWILACFVGGAGFVAYLGALLLLPGEPDEVDGSPGLDPAGAWFGIGLLALSCLVGWTVYDWSPWRPSWAALAPALAFAATLQLVRTRPHLDQRGLTRPEGGRVAMGLVSGLARYTSVDANSVRLTLLVLILWSYGFMVLPYLVIASFLPDDGPA